MPHDPVCRVAGVLLAAGAGRRAGGPKALRRDDDGSPAWVQRAVDVLVAGGCDEVTVVVGAQAAAARDLLTDRDVTVVEAVDWADGMAASLRAGLQSLMIERLPAGGATRVGCACVHLVDLPDVGPAVVRRLLPLASESALVRAGYADRPGHPVLLGREHWAGVCLSAHGDRGAGGYLAQRDVAVVDCADLATGSDVDARA